MFPEIVDIRRAYQVRLTGELEGELEGGPVGWRDLFPITIEHCYFVI